MNTQFPNGAFGLSSDEFAIARAAALEAVGNYGDFRTAEEHQRFIANPWNDHVSIQAAVETVKRIKAWIASKAAPTREQTITRKVASKFGSLYVHVTHTAGRVTHVSFSAPGKFDDTTINDLLQRLGEAATSLAREISQLPEEFI